MKDLFKLKGLFFNALFTIYACLLHAPLARQMETVVKHNQPWVLMAFLLFPLSLLEGYYLPQKLRNSFHQSGKEVKPTALALWFMPALIFRTIIGLGIAAMIFRFITPEILHKSALTPVGTVMALLVLVKELIVMFVCMMILVKNTAKSCPVWLEWAGDIIILIYSCTVFTMITRPGVFFTVNVSMALLPLVFICFLGFLQSLRLGFFVEEHLKAETTRDKVSILGSLLMAAAAAAWALY